MIQKMNPVMVMVLQHNKKIIIISFALGILYCLEIFFKSGDKISTFPVKYAAALILGIGGILFFNFYMQPRSQQTRARQRTPESEGWMGPPMNQGEPIPQAQAQQIQLRMQPQQLNQYQPLPQKQQPSNIWDYFDELDRRRARVYGPRPEPQPVKKEAEQFKADVEPTKSFGSYDPFSILASYKRLR